MRKSLTLIELVIAVIVLSLAFPSLFKFFSDAVRLSVDAESVSTATQIAQSYMEEMHLKRFDEKTDSSYTAHDLLSYENGTNGLDETSAENSSDHQNWDDVDDYNGYDQDYEADGSYHLQIEVFYVEADDLETEVSSETEYKRIKIKVFKKPELDDPAAELDSLVTFSGLL